MTESIAQLIVALADDRAAEAPAFGSTEGSNAKALLSPTALGEMLSNPLVRHPQVRVAHGGKAVPSGEYTTSRRIGTRSVDDGIDAAAVASWLTRGATITIDSLEYLSPAVREICESLTDGLGLAATATAYVTPPGRQGLNPHTDEEDVFVLQTFGTKSWIIDSGQRQRVPAAAGFPFNGAMQAVPARVLEPGHMFYMPAGIPHVATAQDNLSIHITFSVERARIRDVIARKLSSLAARDERLNQLQPWSSSFDESLSDLLRSAEDTTQVGHTCEEDRSARLPFESWENLLSGEVEVLPTLTMSAEETDTGYALHFPRFTMKVGMSVGRILLPLASEKTVRIDLDANDDLRGILFHLSGRGAVHTRQAVPQ